MKGAMNHIDFDREASTKLRNTKGQREMYQKLIREMDK